MAKEKICGIYKIINTITKWVYIGSSKNIPNRFNKHRHHLRKGNHHIEEFQLQFDKYGEDSFKFIILEQCQDNVSKQFLQEREQFYFDRYKLKYNKSPTAGSNLGYKHSKEACLNMSLNSCMKGKLGKDNPYTKPVYQYSLDGKFIRKWHGYYEIERNLGFGIHHIYTAIKRSGTSFGFLWFRDYRGKQVEPQKIRDMTKRCRPVGLYDQSKNLITVFKSILEISGYFGWKGSKSFKYITLHLPKKYNIKKMSHEEYNQNIHLAFRPDETSS